MERYTPPVEGWSVTARVHGPVDKPSIQAIEAIKSGAAHHSDELHTRVMAALTVIDALRLCQPDFFASDKTAKAIERTVGIMARQTTEIYFNFDLKERLKEVTEDLDEQEPGVLDSIDQIVELGQFPSTVRGLSEAIVRHIYKQQQPGADDPN